MSIVTPLSPDVTDLSPDSYGGGGVPGGGGLLRVGGIDDLTRSEVWFGCAA